MRRRGSDHGAHYHRALSPRHPNPNFANAGGLRRRSHRPRLFRDVCGAEHRRARRHRRPRHDLHARPRQRSCGRGGPRAAASRRRLEVRRHRRQPRRLLGAAHVREPAQVDRSGERRDSSRDGGDRKCGLGSLRQSRAQAGVETRRRHDARAVRRMHRLPLSHRRAHARRRARHPAREIRDARRTRSADAQGRLPGLHHVRRMDGLSRRQGSAAVPRGARRADGPASK